MAGQLETPKNCLPARCIKERGATFSPSAAWAWAQPHFRRFWPAIAAYSRRKRPAAVDRHGSAAARARDPLAPRPGHFPARAKSVIYLFMAGGPSQLELFDYKPELQKYSGQPIPDSFIQGRRFAFMDIFTKEHPKLLGTVRPFAQARPVGGVGLERCCRTWPRSSTT